MNRIIIGITGTNGAGKGTIVNILKSKNFKHYSVSDFLTEILVEKKMSVNRDNMIKIANQLRKNNSPSFIVEKLYEKAKLTKGNVIIESIRCPGEVDALKKNKDFLLLGVDANSKLRHERIKSRKSSKDLVSYEKFIEQEKNEFENKEPFKQNIAKCLEMSDVIFNNDDNLESLKNNVLSYFSKK